MLLNTDLAQAMTQERILHLQNVAKEYLQGATDEITIAQVADIPTFLKIFKEMYNGLKVAKEKQQNEIYEKAYAEATEQLTVKAAPSSMKVYFDFLLVMWSIYDFGLFSSKLIKSIVV